MRATLVCPFDPQPDEPDADGAHVGGVERVFAEVSRRLARRGHDVTLVCAGSGASGERWQDGVRVVRDPLLATVLRAPVARLARHIEGDADIVHVPATYPFTTSAVLSRARELGVPAVLDFHFEPAAEGLVGRIATSLYRQVGPRSFQAARVVLVRSLAYGRTATSLAGIPESRWRVVPNGIDPERFHPNGEKPPGDYLLFVGRLVPYKGVAVLLAALAHLRPSLPLLLAGDGPLRHELEERASALGVDARFLGRVPEGALAALYRGARLTLLPSVNGQEAFGMTLAESMACGTPVVASELPGVAEVARLGGLLANPGDALHLAERIRLALDPQVLPRGWELARRAHGAYSWDAVTMRLESIYAEVVGRRSTLAAPEVR